jgi:hypothetical protein
MIPNIIERFQVTVDDKVLEFTRYDDGSEIIVEIENDENQ